MATPGRAPQAYHEAQVLGSDRRELVVLMFRALVRYLVRAEQAMGRRDFEAKADALARANAVLSELICSLDEKTGGELAASLRRLYLWMQAELLEVDLNDDGERLGTLIELTRGLARTWEEALRRCRQEESTVA
ncbi:MAG: flagellar export chaperone FliS [Armatimonadota bacterium]